MNKNLIQERPLASILSSMLAEAQSQPGRLQTKTLKKGLRITMVDVTIQGKESVTLSLNRVNVYPSASEWITVLDAMPWPVGHRSAQRGPNYALTTTFEIHPKLL